jgi:AcrR family transcriptional regulator
MPPRTAPAPDTRTRIVEAAARLLGEDGPDAVTTRRVAEHAGVQAPAIYRLFGDKDGLLDAVAEHVLATYVAAKASVVESAAADGVDPLEDLRAGWQQQVDFGLANPAVFRKAGVELPDDMSPAMRALIIEGLDVKPDDVYVLEGPIDMDDLMQLSSIDRPDLKFPVWKPLTPARLRDDEADIFSVIRAGDLLVHHPYESFAASVERFIEAAAADPKVLAIKMTLYRTSLDSPFVPALIRAAESGKQVAVLVELVGVPAVTRGAAQRGTELGGEDVVAQALRGRDLAGVVGDEKRIAAGPGRCGGGHQYRHEFCVRAVIGAGVAHRVARDDR